MPRPLTPFDGLSLVGALVAAVSSFLTWVSYGTDYGSGSGYSLWSALNQSGLGQQLASLLWLVLVGVVAGLWPLTKLRDAANPPSPASWPPAVALVAAGGLLVHVALSDSVARGEIVGLIGLIAVAAGGLVPRLRAAGATTGAGSGLGAHRHVTYSGPKFDSSGSAQPGPAPAPAPAPAHQATPPYWAAVLQPVDVFDLNGTPQGRATPDRWLLVVEHRADAVVVEDEGRRLLLADRTQLHPA